MSQQVLRRSSPHITLCFICEISLLNLALSLSLSDCIINDNHDYLLEFLEGLALPEHCATIQDWDTAGGVYLDYIRVIKTLQDIQQVPNTSECF